MRYCVFLFAPIVLIAQSPRADQNLSETLIKEVQQLRLAIERSSLLSARTQVIVTELQVHEAAVARLTQQYYDVRTSSEVLRARRSQLTEKVQELEASGTKKAIEQAKAELGDAVDADEKSSARESEVASQLHAEQAALADARSRMAELRQQLDSATQQLPKPN